MKNSFSAIKTSHLYSQPLRKARKDKKDFAKKLDREMTKAEWALWYHLRNHGFKAQKVLFGYIPDFVNMRRQLAVEVDGSIHNGSIQKEKDAEKDRNLSKRGFSVVRFSNEQVLNDMPSVLRRLGIK